MDRHFLPRRTLVGMLFACLSQAGTLYEWDFEDPTGTLLSSTVSTGELKGAWDGDFDRSNTNGSGQFLIARTPGGIANAFVRLSSSDLDSEEIWVILEIDGWNLEGKSAKETLRLGIADIAHEERPHVLAQIRLERTGPNEVSVLTEAFGDGAESMAPLPMFGATQNEPVTFALKIEAEKNRHSLYYQVGGGPLLFLGEGKTSPDRELNYLRFGLSGYFNASDELLAINRIVVQTTPPGGDQ
ncbi:MAG: hypothetical protein ACQKBU_10790 [Verrucomicrobiales bacterium]